MENAGPVSQDPQNRVFVVECTRCGVRVYQEELPSDPADDVTAGLFG